MQIISIFIWCHFWCIAFGNLIAYVAALFLASDGKLASARGADARSGGLNLLVTVSNPPQ